MIHPNKASPYYTSLSPVLAVREPASGVYSTIPHLPSHLDQRTATSGGREAALCADQTLDKLTA